MAYRNTIIAFASVVAFGTACSKAPSYATNVQSGAQDAAAANNNGDHGPRPEDNIVTVPAPTPNKQTPDTPAPTTPAPPANTALQADPAKKLANKALFNMVPVTNAVGWGTSAANRLKVQVAVDAAGAVLPPQAGLAVQYTAKLDPNDPNKIELLDRNGAALTLTQPTSFMVACNQTTANIYLHSGTGGAPFSHGNGAVAPNACVAYPAQNLRANDGATYDHIAGNNPTNYVYLQIEKIGPDGKVVP